MQAVDQQTNPMLDPDRVNAAFVRPSRVEPLTAFPNLGTACVGSRLLNLARAATAMHMAQSLRYAAPPLAHSNQTTGA